MREFSAGELTRAEIGQLLWAGQGLTDEARSLRTAPSAGALFPLELYAATAAGLFWYRPRQHRLLRSSVEDVRRGLCEAALDQPYVAKAPCVLVLTGIVERTRRKYGARALRYVHLEAGHAAKNILLQAIALDLATVPVGAFDDNDIAKIIELDDCEVPLYLIAVGRC